MWLTYVTPQDSFTQSLSLPEPGVPRHLVATDMNQLSTSYITRYTCACLPASQPAAEEEKNEEVEDEEVLFIHGDVKFKHRTAPLVDMDENSQT